MVWKRVMIGLALAAAVGGGVALPASAALGSTGSLVEFTGVGYGNTRAQAENNAFNSALNHAHTAGYFDCEFLDSQDERLGGGWRAVLTIGCIP